MAAMQPPQHFSAAADESKQVNVLTQPYNLITRLVAERAECPGITVIYFINEAASLSSLS
jgi:hypothetical protein